MPLRPLWIFRATLRPALAACLLAGGVAHAQPPTVDSVQASFLPRFARYVGWPAVRRPGPGAPFQLCVIGRDPYGGALDAAAGAEHVDGHGLTVRRLPDERGAEACHLAFVRGRQPDDTGRLLLALRNLPVLTITDARAGPQRGMIHFAIVSGRLRFFINDAAAEQSGLTISSRLLALAAGVTQRR
jgi:hypothetical protein